MTDIVTIGLEVFSLLLKNRDNILFLILLLLSGALYYLIVTTLNNKIMLKRKELSMDVVDSHIEQIITILIDHLHNLPELQLDIDSSHLLESQLIEHVYYKALAERKQEMRRRVRKNGFEKKTPSEWIKYVDTEIKEDLNALTVFLKINWPRGGVIDRSMVKAHNQQIIADVKSELVSIFDSMLEVSTKHKLKRFFGYRAVL